MNEINVGEVCPLTAKERSVGQSDV